MHKSGLLYHTEYKDPTTPEENQEKEKTGMEKRVCKSTA